MWFLDIPFVRLCGCACSGGPGLDVALRGGDPHSFWNHRGSISIFGGRLLGSSHGV